MIVTAVLGSPHGIKGYTSVLASWVLWEAEQAGAAVTGLSLEDYRVSPCHGCDQCHKTGRCPQKDDFPRLARAISNAGGIVLASPMHFFNVSAQTKAFIDRCGSMVMRQPWDGKYGVAVMTSGATDCRNVEEYLLSFMRSMGCWTVGSVSATVASLKDMDSREEAFEAARKLGRDLARCMRDRQTFAEQVPVKDAFRDHMQCLALERKTDWAFEYEFWRHHCQAEPA